MKIQSRTNSEIFKTALIETIKVAVLFAGLVAILLIAIMY
jgi:hypothetical protein